MKISDFEVKIKAVKLEETRPYAWFPLDRNAIVRSHQQNRFWITANVQFKILDINLTKAVSGLWKKDSVAIN